MYSIKRYSPASFDQWNDFLAKSRNGTFLFHRDYMEYHSDRFDDFSLLVFDNDELIALLPAHKTGTTVYSHLGLTYGGLVYSEKLKLREVIRALQAILKYLNENAIEKLYIKMIPAIYHKYPADELSYALFVADAKLVRKDSLCIIEQNNKMRITKSRRENIKRGANNGLVIKEETEFNLFWEKILVPNMNYKHGIKPVHTVEEIKMLHSRFPKNIRQFNVYHNDVIVAGTTVFVTDTVAHPQHISGNRDKNELGSLDFLYDHLINTVFTDKKFFDFGISNEEQGRKLNENLIFWKESFGARTQVQDFYEVETAKFAILDNVLI